MSMAGERLANSDLLQALGQLVGDLSDLIRKEIRLAQAEVTEKVAGKLKAWAWMVVAALGGLLTLGLLSQAAVFAIASFGIAMHWSCLIVATVLAVATLAAFFHARSLADEEMTPRRSLNQITRDIETAKEQLT